MSDYMLFAFSPYIAIIGCLLILIARSIRLRRDDSHLSRHYSKIKQLFWRPALWRVGLLVVVGGHLAVIFLPRQLLIWNDIRPRSIALEWVTIAAGFLIVAGLVQILWRHAQRLTVAEAAFVTVLAVLTVSGLLTGILYRWSTSWSLVTLTPYVRSLWSLNPAVDLVAGMPFLVQLHIFATFALVALFPFTRLSVVVILPLRLSLSPILAGFFSLLSRLSDALAIKGRRATQTVSAWWEAEYE